MSPLVGLYRPRSRRPYVVLPEPVSPTRASVSPRLMASETPSTALSMGLGLPSASRPELKYRATSRVSTTGVSVARSPPVRICSAADTGNSVADVGCQSVPAGVRPAVDFENRPGDVAG